MGVPHENVIVCDRTGPIYPGREDVDQWKSAHAVPTKARSLEEARDELRALATDMAGDVPYDLCAVRLEGAAAALGEVVGLDTPDDVLNRIFESFCIGK